MRYQSFEVLSVFAEKNDIVRIGSRYMQLPN